MTLSNILREPRREITRMKILAPSQTHKIVGAFYRQRDGVCPAKALLTVLPSGTPLILRPEPDNEHDENAIAVWIKTSEIEETEDLISALADCGWTTDHLYEETERPLGYIPAIDAAKIQLDHDVEGRFVFNLKGEPSVTWIRRIKFSCPSVISGPEPN